jgi:hypothetical protein
MREPWRSLVVSAVLVACRGNASPGDCKAMTARYLDLAVKENPQTATMSPTQVAAVRDVEQGLKRAVPAYRFVQDHCEAVTRAETSCAIDADSTRAWEACVHPPDAR